MFCDTFVWFHNICLLLKKNKHWCIETKHSNCFLRLFRLSIAYVLPKKACIKRLLLILDVIWQEFIANIGSFEWMVNLLFVWWFSMNGSLELNWAHAISTLSKHISINKRFIFCEHCELLEKLEYELCWFGIFFSQLQTILIKKKKISWKCAPSWKTILFAFQWNIQRVSVYYSLPVDVTSFILTNDRPLVVNTCSCDGLLLPSEPYLARVKWQAPLPSIEYPK